MAPPTASKRVADSGGTQEILGLLQGLLGTDTTVKSTANIDPLQQVLGQIAGSEATQGQQLLESIFQQAAGKVPQLMGNTFNASGSRAPNSQMAGTLQKLMADIALQAQAQMVQQSQARQQMMLQGAGKIADSTRNNVQKQRIGGNNIVQKGGQVVAALNGLKKLTGVDLVQKGSQFVSGLMSADSSLPSSFSADSAGSGLYGGGGVAAQFGMPALGDVGGFGGFGLGLQALNTAAMPLYTGTASDLPSYLSSATGGVEDPLSALFGASSLMPNASLGDGGTIMFDPQLSLSASPDYTQGGISVSDPQKGFNVSENFSTGGSESAAGDVTLSDAATALKVYDYSSNPNKRKDIFDFSDGNFVDDVGDITDAASIAYPPLAAIRPAMNATVAAASSLDNFVHNPGQWFEDLFSGNEPITESAWNTAVGTVESIGNLGENIISGVENFADDVGDFFGDIFGW